MQRGVLGMLCIVPYRIQRVYSGNLYGIVRNSLVTSAFYHAKKCWPECEMRKGRHLHISTVQYHYNIVLCTYFTVRTTVSRFTKVSTVVQYAAMSYKRVDALYEYCTAHV